MVLRRFRFPNLGQTCYMNSTLQGLLTLTPFVTEVHNQQPVWRSNPKFELIRYSHTPIRNHEDLCRSFSPPSFALSRRFADVGVCRVSWNMAKKGVILANFKDTVAESNSKFEDNRQKVSAKKTLMSTEMRTLSNSCVSAQDAHEFLICVLDELRTLSVPLRLEAAMMGSVYTCPVEAHIFFKMLSTRTCKR